MIDYTSNKINAKKNTFVFITKLTVNYCKTKQFIQ